MSEGWRNLAEPLTMSSTALCCDHIRHVEINELKEECLIHLVISRFSLGYTQFNRADSNPALGSDQYFTSP